MNTFKRKALFCAVLASIATATVTMEGCASAPPVSAEQLAAVTRENNASVGCATGTGPWGRAGVVYVNAQNANIISGRVSVNTDCSVQIDAVSPGVPQVITAPVVVK